MKNSIEARRREMGLSQEALAAKAGVSRPYLSTVETGAANPTVPVALKLAQALGTTVDGLFEDDGKGRG